MRCEPNNKKGVKIKILSAVGADIMRVNYYWVLIMKPTRLQKMNLMSCLLPSLHSLCIYSTQLKHLYLTNSKSVFALFSFEQDRNDCVVWRDSIFRNWRNYNYFLNIEFFSKKCITVDKSFPFSCFVIWFEHFAVWNFCFVYIEYMRVSSYCCFFAIKIIFNLYDKYNSYWIFLYRQVLFIVTILFYLKFFFWTKFLWHFNGARIF